jgi:lysophospholipase L1-like esterase
VANGCLSVLVAAIVLASACGDGPIAPDPPQPQLTCPPPLNLTGVLGGARNVTYAPPLTAGGAAPVSTTCTPASGSSFPIGITTVTCTATDARSRQAGCTFTVTLNAESLSITRFLAFGDSVTAGEDGRTLHIRQSFIDPVRAYPAVLQGSLMVDFPQQNPTVINRGRGGEFATDGVSRLLDELRAQRPEGLLLLEGYNDLLNFGLSGVDRVVEALRTDIRNARALGVRSVFLSTLTPSRRATGPANRAIDSRAIQDVNAKLTVMAAAESAILVNAYDAFLGRESELVGDDGLHLTAAGNQALAQLFYSRIRTAAAAMLAGN